MCKHSSTPPIAVLAAILAVALPAASVAVTSSAPGTGLRYIDTHLLELTIDETAQGAAPIRDHELWLTRDDGQTWERAREAQIVESMVRVEVPEDGRYGFQIVAVDAAGHSEPTPVAGSAPEIECVVDTTPPQLAVGQPQGVATLEAGALLDLQWQVADLNLNALPVTAWFRSQGDSGWQPIDLAPAYPARYRMQWQPPLSRGFLELRLVAGDLAGNVTEWLLADPIALLAAPVGGSEAGGGAGSPIEVAGPTGATPVVEVKAPARPGSEPTVSIITADEDIRVVLDALADQTGYNIVLPESVKMTVRVRLADVSLTEALEALLPVNGFQHQIVGRTILVLPAPDGDSGAIESHQPPLATGVFSLRHIPVASVRATVQGLLSSRGQFIVVAAPRFHSWDSVDFLPGGDPGTSTSELDDENRNPEDDRAYRFVVLDEQQRLDTIGKVIEQLDTPRKLVYISTIVFEMDVNEEEQIGFRWRISTSLSPSSLPWNFPFGSHDVGEYTVGVDPGDAFFPGPDTLFPNSAGSDFLFGRVDLSGSQLLMELNRLGGHFNLLSNPRLMVEDRQEAVILVGEQFPILSSTITDQGTVTEAFDRYEPIGVQLRVQPRVLEGNKVDMLIEPQVTTLGSLVVGTTGLTTPRIATRKMASKLQVDDGTSVVIAGLVNERENEQITAVPILSRIPLLGRLFRHRSTTTEKTDLVIVVTPYVESAERRYDLDRELENSGVREAPPEPPR